MYPQQRDSGVYECQISTTPPVGYSGSIIQFAFAISFVAKNVIYLTILFFFLSKYIHYSYVLGCRWAFKFVLFIFFVFFFLVLYVICVVILSNSLCYQIHLSLNKLQALIFLNKHFTNSQQQKYLNIFTVFFFSPSFYTKKHRKSTINIDIHRVYMLYTYVRSYNFDDCSLNPMNNLTQFLLKQKNKTEIFLGS